MGLCGVKGDFLADMTQFVSSWFVDVTCVWLRGCGGGIGAVTCARDAVSGVGVL